jgi:hypothetical protein
MRISDIKEFCILGRKESLLFWLLSKLPGFVHALTQTVRHKVLFRPFTFCLRHTAMDDSR